MIKNAGGGIAQTGGYIVGKEELVENAAIRLTAPGIGKEEGATLTNMHEFYEGFFLALHTTGEAIKGMIFSAALLEKWAVKSRQNGMNREPTSFRRSSSMIRKR